MIYLASPYCHKDKRVMEDRHIKVCSFTAQLIDLGYMAYSPIAHNSLVVKFRKNPNPGFDDWREYDFHFILLSDYIIILRLYDWEKSKGVSEEIIYANTIKKRIYYLNFGMSNKQINRLLP